MDIRFATNSEQFPQILEQQKRTLQRAKTRQGQRPRDRKSREEAYSGFMMAMMLRQMHHLPYGVHTSYVPPSYLPSVAPISELSRLAIRDLQLELHHRGTYLLLRSITPPTRMTAIMSIMEDEHGDAVMIQLYQQEDETSRPAKNVIGIGSILLIKEPYFKIMADGDYGLRVDHVSDVVHLENNHAMIPPKWRPLSVETEATAESLKVEGNVAIKENRNWDAIQK